ncbi:unnamed protein product, partial [Rhizophagus irregularis]
MAANPPDPITEILTHRANISQNIAGIRIFLDHSTFVTDDPHISNLFDSANASLDTIIQYADELRNIIEDKNNNEVRLEGLLDDAFNREEYLRQELNNTRASILGIRRTYEDAFANEVRRRQYWEGLAQNTQIQLANIQAQLTMLGTSTKRKVRTKMVPAPIENVNEFDIAKYISDLPCGLSIGQATAQLPVYRKGLIQSMRRKREKVDNNNYIGESYYGDSNSEEETPTTAAKCEFHINQQPVIAVIDSGAAVSIMTTAMMKTLKLTIDGPSEYVIKTANGTRVRSLGEIQDLPLKVRNLIIKTNVQIIESSDSVFILGNNWMRKVNAALDWNKKMLTIRYNGRSTTVPVIFTLPKPIKIKQSFEYDDEEEYESEELEEAQIYMSDFSGYSTEESLEFNPWENEVSLAHQNNEDEELGESNPAIYLAQAE